MSVVTNNSLDLIRSSYEPRQAEETEKEEALGRDTFLTMLVAQLQNQDPLNPMEGTDFSAQLAQFSQLEQLMGINKTMTTFAKSSNNDSTVDILGYIGKQITGNVDSISVNGGTVSNGSYTLGKSGSVMVNIYNDKGVKIRTIYPGSKQIGSHTFEWDGKDNNGKRLSDGDYKYSVMANTGNGFVNLPSTVSGEVDGISYNKNKAYLVVKGALIDSDKLMSISTPATKKASTNSSTNNSNSSLSYLGTIVSTNNPIIQVENKQVIGNSNLSFNLDEPENISVNIINSSGQVIRTITINKDKLSKGNNLIKWDGKDNSGKTLNDGLYSYAIKTDSGQTAKTKISEKVAGIQYINDNQYLVLKDSKRLVLVSNITKVSND